MIYVRNRRFFLFRNCLHIYQYQKIKSRGKTIGFVQTRYLCKTIDDFKLIQGLIILKGKFVKTIYVSKGNVFKKKKKIVRTCKIKRCFNNENQLIDFLKNERIE